MTHLDEGTLQAFLDDELPPARRSETAEHLMACERCHAAYEEVMGASALFSRSVAVLDVDSSDAARPDRARPGAPAGLARGASPGRSRMGSSSFIRAAGLILALSAAASAAVPGSPVRDWIETRLEPREEPAPEVVAPPSVSEAPAPRAGAPAGVSIGFAAGELVVSLSGLEEMAIRLEPAPGERAIVSVLAARRDPVFRTRAGVIEVRDGVDGEVRVALPVARDGARLEVDGRVHAETRDGTLVLRVAADTTDGAIIWP